MAIQGYGELIRAILHLEASIARQRDAKQQVEVKIELSDKLAATASPGAKVSILGKYAGTGAFAGREHEVARNLSAYRRNKRAYETLRASRDRLQQRIDVLQRRYAAMSPGSRAPGGFNYQKAADIKDRVRLIQQAKRDALLSMRGHKRRATSAAGAAESAALGGQGAASIALSAARLSTAVTALTAAYKVGQAVVGAAEANLHRYGGYSAGGMHAQLYERIGDFTRNIYVSHKTSESMIEFAKANTKLKDSFADLNVAMINLTNKLGAGIATAVAGAINAAMGKEKVVTPEQAQAAFEAEDPAMARRAIIVRGRKQDLERTIDIIEREIAAAKKDKQMAEWGPDPALRGENVKQAEEAVEQAILKRESAEKERVDLIEEENKINKRINDIRKKLEGNLKKEAGIDEMREKHFQAFQQQIRDIPQFGRKAVDLDDPRAARTAADYLARVRSGGLSRIARGLWMRGGRNVDIHRMPGGGVRGGRFRRRGVPNVHQRFPLWRAMAERKRLGMAAVPGLGGAFAAGLPRIPDAINQAFAGMSNDQLMKKRRDIAQKKMDAAARRREAARLEDEAAKRAGKNAADDPAREAASGRRRAIDAEIRSYEQMIHDINVELKARTAADRPQNVSWMMPTPSRRDPTLTIWT